jgi:hypothetical protein
MSVSKSVLCVSLAALTLFAWPAFAQTNNSPPQTTPVATSPATAPGNPNASGTGSTNQPSKDGSGGPSAGGMAPQTS